MSPESDHADPRSPSFHSEAQSHRSTSQELKTQLEPELLRGVPLDVALAGWGRHWETPDSGMFNVDPKSYELSRATESLDVFLSHDWASSGTLKFLSLLIVYNSHAAFLACLSVSVLVGVLRGYGVLPNEGWTVVLGHGTFLLVFAFWQRLRRFLCRPFLVFLDKLCVAQHDEELKQKGIKGLAAFLLSSRQLVVLLTPRYFTRLWCTLEIATFMKDPQRRKRIQFMPLKTAVLLLLSAGCWFALAIGWNAFAGVVNDDSPIWHNSLILTGLMLLLTSVVLPFVFYLGMGIVADLEEMPRQLAGFNAKEAECFCCSNGHRHPHDGSKLPCDRLLVYNTLKQWYGQEGEVDHLERFSRQVREELAPSIALLIGGMTLPLNYAVYMVGASFLPYLADHVAQWIASVHAGISGYALFARTLRMLSDWGTAPLASMLATWMCLPMWKTGLWLENRWCAAIAAQLIIFVLVAVVWGPLQYLLASTAEDSLLPVAVFFAWFTLVLALFSCGQRALLWAMQTTVRDVRASDTVVEAREAGESVKVEDPGQEAASKEDLTSAISCPPLEGTFFHV
ncbi:hypothetical protein AK812_SmicGene19041 [Symbiodinium microadriaticum]|uniref:Uncharacterized protein n=1 Tax=Symbiodinium microadriaticum TaxID=2951 RepID=A0A1Q9DTJ2_SYMMI|nr:hypothetical protein AK812_SmicGene19041 [Symbiodinium microadriaticum]CAE7900275.1 unnamed protein product [Symbiodinium microadriaticum]CAE7946259.1 unnamed protein product [Symbiodinium sp. KB8]